MYTVNIQKLIKLATGIVPVQNLLFFRDGLCFANGHGGRGYCRMPSQWRNISCSVDSGSLKAYIDLIDGDHTVEVKAGALVISKGKMKARLSTIDEPFTPFKIEKPSVTSVVTSDLIRLMTTGSAMTHDEKMDRASHLWVVDGVLYATDRMVMMIATCPTVDMSVATNNVAYLQDGATVYMEKEDLTIATDDCKIVVRQADFVAPKFKDIIDKFTHNFEFQLSAEEIKQMLMGFKNTLTPVELGDGQFSANCPDIGEHFSIDLPQVSVPKFKVSTPSLKKALSVFSRTGCTIKHSEKSFMLSNDTVSVFIMKLIAL